MDSSIFKKLSYSGADESLAAIIPIGVDDSSFSAGQPCEAVVFIASKLTP